MKRLKKGVIALCLVCTAAMWHTDIASAKSLSCTKAYVIDLNGDGTTENIKWTEKEFNDKCTVKLYINGKKLATATSKHGLTAQVSVVDIDETDKYKDIYVQITSESDGFEKGFGYRYQNGKLKKYFTFDQPTTGRLSILENQPGDGCIWFSSEYSDSYIMQGYARQPYEIISGRLKPVNKKVLNTTAEWRKKNYRATKALKVYAALGDEEPAFTLPKKTTFHVCKIKAKDAGKLYQGVSYIYIQTDTGKSGWIKNPEKEIFMGEYDGTWTSYAYLWG
ncbi:MAG: hypothetical protein ACI4FX_12295 [Agathobacter sp.]